jgi:hypothetical protein
MFANGDDGVNSPRKQGSGAMRRENAKTCCSKLDRNVSEVRHCQEPIGRANAVTSSATICPTKLRRAKVEDSTELRRRCVVEAARRIVAEMATSSSRASVQFLPAYASYG